MAGKCVVGEGEGAGEGLVVVEVVAEVRNGDGRDLTPRCFRDTSTILSICSSLGPACAGCGGWCAMPVGCCAVGDLLGRGVGWCTRRGA